MTLLVPVNGSKASLVAVTHAAAVARQKGSEVILVNVQPLLPSYVARFVSRAARDALRAERSEAALSGARRLLEAAGVRYQVVTAPGNVAKSVAAIATHFRAEQIVIGAMRRAGWWQAFFSPLPQIIDLTTVPVVVISEGRSGALERYGVPACLGLGLGALVIAVE
jgi:nucleotide-binding universal stress UspA family protein